MRRHVKEALLRAWLGRGFRGAPGRALAPRGLDWVWVGERAVAFETVVDLLLDSGPLRRKRLAVDQSIKKV